MILGDLVTSLNLLILAYRIYIFHQLNLSGRYVDLLDVGGGYLSHLPFHTGRAHATTR